MKFIFLLIGTICVLYFSACNKNCTTDPGFFVGYNGFNTTDLHQIIIKAYSKSTHFATLSSVTILGDTATLLPYISADTTFSTITAPSPTETIYAGISPDYDYIIDFPATNEHDTIRDISFHSEKVSVFVSDYSCDNKASYYINDSSKSYPGYFAKHGNQQVVIINIYK